MLRQHLEKLKNCIDQYSQQKKMNTKEFIENFSAAFSSIQQQDHNEVDACLTKMSEEHLFDSQLGSWVGHILNAFSRASILASSQDGKNVTQARSYAKSIEARLPVFREYSDIEFLRKVVAIDIFYNDSLPGYADVKAAMIDSIVRFQRQYGNIQPKKEYQLSVEYAEFFIDLLATSQKDRITLDSFLVNAKRLTPQAKAIATNELCHYLMVREGYYKNVSPIQKVVFSVNRLWDRYTSWKFIWYNLNKQKPVRIFVTIVLTTLLALGILMNMYLCIGIQEKMKQMKDANLRDILPLMKGLVPPLSPQGEKSLRVYLGDEAIRPEEQEKASDEKKQQEKASKDKTQPQEKPVENQKK